MVVDSNPGTEVCPLLITKGALDSVLSVCTQARVDDRLQPLDEPVRASIAAQYATWSKQGYRVLGLAVREVPRLAEYPVTAEERRWSSPVS